MVIVIEPHNSDKGTQLTGLFVCYLALTGGGGGGGIALSPVSTDPICHLTTRTINKGTNLGETPGILQYTVQCSTVQNKAANKYL